MPNSRHCSRRFMMAIMGRWLVLCTLLNIRSVDFLTCICSYSWRVVENVKDTALLGWFKANQDPDLIAAGAHDYLYQEFPKKFIWHKGQAVWKIRQQYKAIGRMYTIPIFAGEAFYMRLLLTVVKGIDLSHYTITIRNSCLILNRHYIL